MLRKGGRRRGSRMLPVRTTIHRQGRSPSTYLPEGRPPVSPSLLPSSPRHQARAACRTPRGTIVLSGIRPSGPGAVTHLMPSIPMVVRPGLCPS